MAKLIAVGWTVWAWRWTVWNYSGSCVWSDEFGRSMLQRVIIDQKYCRLGWTPQ